MSAHTPGPWRKDRGALKGSDGTTVLASQLGIALGSDRGDGIGLANTRLIETAPELLSVAMEADALINGELVGAEWKAACYAFTKKARAAIAAATGAK